MRIQEITEQARWDALVQSLPGAHLLQSWEWGELKRRVGWQPARLAFERDGRAVAAAAVLARRAAPLPVSVMYAPKGPVMDYSDEALCAEVLAALEQHARARGALFVKVDPDAPDGSPLAALLARRGWRPGAQIQFRGTMLLDLTRGEDELLAAMKSKTRYNIRLAARKGVTVRAGGTDDLPEVYRMYAETSVRDGFVIRPYEYYCDAWGRFMTAGMAQLLIARADDSDMAAVLIYRYGARAYYLNGASRALHRERMPNYLLQWEAIRWAKAQGCTLYDFWGAPDELPPEDADGGVAGGMLGVYRFKQGFAAHYARWIGAYDYAVSPAGYWAYTRVMPRLLDVLRRGARRRAAAQAAPAAAE